MKRECIAAAIVVNLISDVVLPVPLQVNIEAIKVNFSAV
jgi:hypothetical protein